MVLAAEKVTLCLRDPYGNLTFGENTLVSPGESFIMGALALSTRRRIVVVCRLAFLGSANSLLWAFLG